MTAPLRKEVRTATLPVSVDPDDGDVVAIGDVHGDAGLLRALLSETSDIARESDRVTLVFLGDLIDRGPSSIACLDLAVDARALTGAARTVSLMGNHEMMLAMSVALDVDPLVRHDAYGCWLANGGTTVLAELGLADRRFDARIIRYLRDALGSRRLGFLEGLVASHASGDVLFVHAGVNPHVDIDAFLAAPWKVGLSGDFDEEGHWAWVRDPFLDHLAPTGHSGRFVVHGHSIDDGRRTLDDTVARWRINADAGSYRTGRARLVHLRGREARTVTVGG